MSTALKYRSQGMIFCPLVLFSLTIFNQFTPSTGYCKSIGWNPTFTAAPTVVQIERTTVQVSWAGVVDMAECADQYRVKYWKSYEPNNYLMSNLLPTDVTGVILKDIIPGIEFIYQAIAREDKGWKGVDYNKSPEVSFTTSSSYRSSNDDENDKDLHVVESEIYGADEKYETIEEILAVKKHPNGDSNNDQESQNDPPPGGADFEERVDSNNINEGGFSITTLTLIIVGGIIFGLIVAGITYNCIKRSKDGRHIISGKKLEEGVSFKAVNQSEDDHASENDAGSEKLKDDDTSSLKSGEKLPADGVVPKEEEDGLLAENKPNVNSEDTSP